MALYVQTPFRVYLGGTGVLGWGLGWGNGFKVTKSHCRQTNGFICTATLSGITGGDWGFRVGTGVGEWFQSDKITL